jgi:hypothetical protein
MMLFTGLNRRHEIELSRHCVRLSRLLFLVQWLLALGCGRRDAVREGGGLWRILVGFAMKSQQKVKIEIGQETLNGWHVCDEALNRLVVSNENGPDVYIYFIDSDSFILQCGTMLAFQAGFTIVTWSLLLTNILCKAYKAADTLFLHR